MMSDELKNKKKVCFVSPFAYGLFNPGADLKFGGSEVQMYLISKELAKDENYSISFVVLDLNQKEVEGYDNIDVYRAYKRGRDAVNLIKAPLRLFNVLKKIDPDVVVCRANGVEAGISAVYARMFKKKFIYSIAHDGDVRGDYFKGFRGGIFKYGFLKADILVAQNEEQLNRLNEKYPNKNISIIKNSFSIGSEFKEKERDIVLWVASSAPVKRPDVYVQLAKENPKEKFVMVMAKSKMGLAIFDDIYKQASIIDNLEIIERIPFKEIDDYFKRAKVFVSTSEAEGFPNTFLQSALYRVPVLSLKINPDGFIDKYKCGVACGDDYEKLKSSLNNILEDSDLRIELGNNAYELLTKEHDIEKNILEWKIILKI